MDLRKFKHILVTDVGSTTTKALLIARKGERYHFAGELEVPTTVEKPREDVKIGVLEAVKGVGEKTGTTLLKAGKISVPYVTTSSAGGGLQILVFGLSAVETGRAAEMTAYGAGGVILRTFTIDDAIPAVDKMRLIRELHPDLILMAGGIDGGAIAGVVRLAELLSLADPEPKFRLSERIPLVFCGNVDARGFVKNVLEQNFELHITENIRPSMTELATEPAKRKVHELFMENVMERAPGYAGLKRWVAADIMPTPAGVENILRLYGDRAKQNVVMVDMGGATTDIFSNVAGEYRRTVAANIGMSYSISNILAEAGVNRIMRHLPEEYPEEEVRDYVSNKMLNPTYVPKHASERVVEQATAIEGINLAWNQHLEMNFQISRIGRLDARRLRKDVNKFEELFYLDEERYFQLSDIDLIIGAGGVLSHAKRAEDVLWMLAEGFKPSGITRFAVDKGFKSPHLGVLAKLDSKVALELFRSQCLEEIGYVVAPVGKLHPKRLALTIKDAKGHKAYALRGGEFLYLPQGGDLEILLERGLCIRNNLERFELKTLLPVLFDCRGRDEPLLGVPLSRSGIAAFTPTEGAFKTEVRKAAAEISTGEYRIERRLPYEGEIFVKKGNKVKPDDVIGENRFGPPKLYIIDIQRAIGYDKKLDEKAFLAGIMVKVGDQVKLGQKIYKAKSAAPLSIPYYCQSPLRGKVTQIEASGKMIIMREIQDYDGKPHVVDVAKKLDIKPGHIKAYMKFQEGDFIEIDRIIAQKTHAGRFVMAKATSTGTLKKIDSDAGTVTIQYEIKPIQLKSFVKGKVSKVKENLAAEITGKGTMLYGIIGFGGEASGRIALLRNTNDLNYSHKERIAVAFKPIDEGFLRRAAEIGVAGIVAPSIHNADWVRFWGEEIGVALTGDEQIPFVLILTEGFGSFEMNERYRSFFVKAESKTASLSGRTQIRAGVTRPTVIVSD
jgi:uncharacterized protein (TIGR01319 family)